MAELTVADLQDTYIKLSKSAKIYSLPSDGEAGKPIWWTKQAGEIAGKLYSWINKNPSTGKKYKYVYLMFKINDDFDNVNAKSYFIRLEKNQINWAFTKEQLIKKSQANMSEIDKFIDDLERNITESVTNYVDDLTGYVKSGLLTGGGIAATVLLFSFVIVPYVKFRILKSTARELIKEGKRV